MEFCRQGEPNRLNNVLSRIRRQGHWGHLQRYEVMELTVPTSKVLGGDFSIQSLRVTQAVTRN